MLMKKWILLTAVTFLVLPMMAQDDDMYFVPTKENLAKEAESYGMPKNTYYSGSKRSIDDYNRRTWSSAVPIDSAGNDIINFSAVRGVYPDSTYTDAGNDYKYTRELARFDNYVSTDAAYWEGYRDGRWSSPWYYTSYYSTWYDPWYDPWYYGGYYGYYSPWRYGWYSYYRPWGYYGWYTPRYYYVGRGHSYTRHYAGHNRPKSPYAANRTTSFRNSSSNNGSFRSSTSNNSSFSNSSRSASFSGSRNSGGFSGGGSHSSGGSRPSGGGGGRFGR